MSKNNNKKHPILTIVLIAVAAIVLGGGTSLGINLYRTNSEKGKSVIEAPIIGEISTTSDTVSDDSDDAAFPVISSTDPARLSVSSSDVSAIVESVMPAIVSIDCISTYTYYDFFGFAYDEDAKSSGTGFIIASSRDKLFIATNNHVIDGATSITVPLNEDVTVDADIVGMDADYDLAVISINLDDLDKTVLQNIRMVSIGNSDNLAVGDMTIAIGNALGYGHSTTVGYVSALNREVTIDDITKPLIQTDTAINPGNSGGPLLNIYGQVIGINSIKFADEKVEGMGYAIPMADAIPIINDLIQYVTLEESEIGYLGIEGKDVSSSYSYGFGMPMGIYINDIAPDSPASESELCIGDIITAFNGRSIKTMEEFKNRISHIRAGETITLTVSTLKGGRYVEHDVKITLANRPTE